MKMLWLGACAALGLMIFGSPAQAAFVTPQDGTTTTGSLGWTRSNADPNTTYQHWDVFTEANGPHTLPPPPFDTGAPAGGTNAPDVADENPNPGSATLEQLSLPDYTDFDPGNWIFGGVLTTVVDPATDPNIYSFDSALTFEVVVPEQGLGSGFTRVLAQWNTLGSILDINDVAGNAPRLGGELPTYTEILFEGVAPGPFGDGTDLEYLAVWDLVGNPSELSITFGAPGPHMSLAELIVDSAWSDTPFAAFNTEAIVPEPSSAVLVALSSILALCIQGRRRSRS